MYGLLLYDDLTLALGSALHLLRDLSALPATLIPSPFTAPNTEEVALEAMPAVCPTALPATPTAAAPVS